MTVPGTSTPDARPRRAENTQPLGRTSTTRPASRNLSQNHLLRTVTPLTAGISPQRSPPRLLTRRSLRWFEFSACTANPEGQPPSLAQHVSLQRSPTSSSLDFQDSQVDVVDDERSHTDRASLGGQNGSRWHRVLVRLLSWRRESLVPGKNRAGIAVRLGWTPIARGRIN